MLWHQIVHAPEPHKNAELVTEFLDIWFQTRRSSDLVAGNYAGRLAVVIDLIYEAQPGEGAWTTVKLKSDEIRNYIKVYLKDGKKQQTIVSAKDKILYGKYRKLLEEGFRPPPIILAGSSEKTGFYLIDGRHRIYAHCEAGRKTIEAYIPVEDIEILRKATL